MSTVVQARGLARRFGHRWAVARLDLEVQPGERVLVFGANGSGKTTLLKMIATLLGPTSGELRLFGLDPTANAPEVRRRLAIVSHSLGLYEDLSGLDNLRVFGGLMGRPAGPDLLEAVGLEARPEPVRSYSAGMRKRLALALMLLKQPELVLLDEPFAALDPAGMDRVGELVRGLSGTVLVASHQIERAGALCDRALLLDQGLPRWLGPAKQAWAAWGALHARTAPTLEED